MTTVYFVRHAQPNLKNHDDCTRELTQKGQEDRKKVTCFFENTDVDAVLSSPYKRAMDTVRHLAESKMLPIIPISDFRERKVDSGWIRDFDGFCRHQWEDFDFRLSDGESLRQVQRRNITALETVLKEYANKTVIIGGHGTSMSTIYQYYDPSFGYEDFQQIKNRMPWVLKFTFDGHVCQKIEEFDLK